MLRRQRPCSGSRRWAPAYSRTIDTDQRPPSCAPASTSRHTEVCNIALCSMQTSVLLTSRCGVLLIITAILGCLGCNPTASRCKDEYGRGETGFNLLTLECSTIGSRLQCRSVASIHGSYVYCPMSEDATSSAVWTAGDAGVLRSFAPGVFEAAGIGDTFVRATWRNIDSAMRPVSVFTGTPPLTTGEIRGAVYPMGQMMATAAINGAVVEILDGLVAGRSSITGVPPPLLAGWSPAAIAPGFYRLMGLPAGTYRLRVRKDGYVSQERDVTITGSGGGPLINFQLQPL